MVRRTGQALALAAAAAVSVIAAAPSAVRADPGDKPIVFVPAVTPEAAAAAGQRKPLLMDTNQPGPATIPSQTPATTTPFSPMAPAGYGPTTAESAPVTTNPLMGLLVAGGVGKPLQDAGISVYGWVDGGWTYDQTNTPDRLISGRQFDTRNKSIQLDQVDVTVARQADYTKAFDVGFTVENMYGFDSAYLHANGLTIQGPDRTAGRYPGTGGTLHISPHAQYDLVQANATFASNALGGVGLEIGKFDKLIGYEAIDAYSPAGATQNAFYSRSFIFTQEPFTHTGALVQYAGIKNVFVQGGITRGWDQSVNDDNGELDYTAQIKFSPNSNTFVSLGAITGNENPSGIQDGWRTVIDLTAQQRFGDRLALGVNAMYAWEAQAGNGGLPGGTGQWYGAAVYASYDLLPRTVQLNVRGEWFNDPDGAAPTQYNTQTIGSPAYQRPIGRSNTYYELTAGATIHPFSEDKYLSGFFIRPEVRLDYADHATWAGGTKNYQLTAAVEAVYSF